MDLFPLGSFLFTKLPIDFPTGIEARPLRNLIEVMRGKKRKKRREAKLEWKLIYKVACQDLSRKTSFPMYNLVCVSFFLFLISKMIIFWIVRLGIRHAFWRDERIVIYALFVKKNQLAFRKMSFSQQNTFSIILVKVRWKSSLSDLHVCFLST